MNKYLKYFCKFLMLCFSWSLGFELINVGLTIQDANGGYMAIAFGLVQILIGSVIWLCV